MRGEIGDDRRGNRPLRSNANAALAVRRDFLVGRLHDFVEVSVRQRREQVGYGDVLVGVVAQGQVGVDAVDVSPSLSALGEVSLLLQVGDYLVGGALGHAYLARYFARGAGWMLVYVTQHHAVVCDEGPYS